MQDNQVAGVVGATNCSSDNMVELTTPPVALTVLIEPSLYSVNLVVSVDLLHVIESNLGIQILDRLDGSSLD